MRGEAGGSGASPASRLIVRTGGTHAHLRKRPGLRLSLHSRGVGCVQQLPAPGRANRRRPVDVPHIRARLSGVQVPRAPRRPATHCRSAGGEGGGVHRTHAGSRHRPRLERPARRRHTLGVAHEERGERGRNRRGAGRDRRPAHCRGLDPRPLSPTATRAGTSSDGSGWSFASSHEHHDPATRSGAWLDRIRVGRLARRTDLPDTTPEAG